MPAVECPQTLEEFQARLESLALTAAHELTNRFLAGERGFAVEFFLDRSELAADESFSPGSSVPINVLQRQFYDLVEPTMKALDVVGAYAQFVTIPDPFDDEFDGCIQVRHIMVFGLSVAGEFDVN